MSSDLRDQLHKLGLVSATDVQAADSQRRKPKTGGKRKAGDHRKKPAGKKAADKDGNADAKFTGPLKTSVSDTLPVRQRVMELVKQHGCNDKRSQQEYFFTAQGGSVRSVVANKTQQRQLADGVLAVVTPQQNRDPYVLVPANVADIIVELMPQRIVLWHGQQERVTAALAKAVDAKEAD